MDPNLGLLPRGCYGRGCDGGGVAGGYARARARVCVCVCGGGWMSARSDRVALLHLAGASEPRRTSLADSSAPAPAPNEIGHYPPVNATSRIQDIKRPPHRHPPAPTT